MTALEGLKKTRELISDEKRWCKFADARREDGVRVSPISESACCYCLTGAMWKVMMEDLMHESEYQHMVATVKKHANWFGHIQKFNDKLSTTHEDVINALDKSIADLEEVA